MNDVKKSFLRDCALYIKGELTEIKISGPKKTVSLFSAVLSESRKLYLALEDDNLKSVIPQLIKKKHASQALREQTGYVWPL